jgi:hypothetical protein
MITPALAFPFDIPTAYNCLDDEPVYDAQKHLALEKPTHVESLQDFGYDQSEIDQCPSPVAVAGPFRVLSGEGQVAVKQVLQQLRVTAETDTGNRAPNYVAGGVYKSKFLRDMCSCPVLIKLMSDIAGTELAVHSIPHQQLYVNFAPEDITKAVDSWHIDSIDFDCVILLEDPNTLDGGKFQYFRGTDKEAAELFDTTTDQLTLGFPVELPEQKVVSAQKTQAGDAVFQQGSKVVHRAQKLNKPAERTTLVISFVTADVKYQDMNNVASILTWAHPGGDAELARHAAWRAQSRLTSLINDLSINAGASDVLDELEFAVNDVTALIELMRKRE